MKAKSGLFMKEMFGMNSEDTIFREHNHKCKLHIKHRGGSIPIQFTILNLELA